MSNAIARTDRVAVAVFAESRADANGTWWRSVLM